MLGIWLWESGFDWSPFALTVMAALITIAYFWKLKLGTNAVIRSARSMPGSPLKAVLRYFARPAMRTAYLITLSRSIFCCVTFLLFLRHLDKEPPTPGFSAS